MQERRFLGFFNHPLSADFMPHGYCYLWDPRIVWLNVVSDGLIALSYYCIPVVLIYFIRKRRDLPFNWIFWMFGGFILACGTTHLMEVWNIWHASYAVAGMVKALTAAISVATLIRLIPLLPQAVAVPSLIQLHERNQSLEREIARRRQLDAAQIDAPLRHRVTAAITLAVFLIGFMGFLSVRSTRSASAEGDLAAYNRAVMQAVYATLEEVVKTETNARGFALSGNAVLLSRYRISRDAVNHDLAALRQLTADGPGQQSRMALLNPQIGAALAFADEMIAKRIQTQTMLEGPEVLKRVDLLDSLQSTAQAVQKDESQLLNRRTQDRAAAGRRSSLITISSTLLGAIFLVLSGFTIHREMDANAAVRSQLNTLNAELEQRVEQRTAAQKKTQDQLEGILGSAMDAIITVNSEQRILLFNTAAEKMFRCPALEAMGEPIIRFIPQRFHAAHEEDIRRFDKTGITNRAMGSRSALWAARADGEEFQIEASISQMVTGETKLFTVILRDVTERKQTEAVLRTSEETLRLLLDGVKDYAVYMLDPEGRVASWNAGAARIKGYTTEEILGKSLSIFYPPEQQADGIPGKVLQYAISKGRYEGQGQRIRKDGSSFWAQVVIHPLYDKPVSCAVFPRFCMTSPSRKSTKKNWRLKPKRCLGSPGIVALAEGCWRRRLACFNPCSTAWPKGWSPPTNWGNSPSGTLPPRRLSVWERPRFPPRTGHGITVYSWTTW